MLRRWILPGSADPLAAGRLLRELSIPSFLASLLVRRGFSDVSAAGEYLSPKMRSLAAPELLPEMPRAVARVLAAVKARERIVLYGWLC